MDERHTGEKVETMFPNGGGEYIGKDFRFFLKQMELLKLSCVNILHCKTVWPKEKITY